MDAAALVAVAPGSDRIDLVVADLSFISLRTVLPALVDTVGTGADYVMLIKPQFEVGRAGIREGIVVDPHLRADAVAGVLRAAAALGLPTAGLIASPLPGTAGNLEYLAWFSTATGTDPTQWSDRVMAITGSS